MPRFLDQRAGVDGDLEDRLAVGVEDRRHEQRVVRGDGDADVHAAEADHPAVLEAAVHGRVLAQRQPGGVDEEVVHGRERRATLPAQLVAERGHALHVDRDLERELRDLGPRPRHPLDDRALGRRQVDDGLLTASARSGGGRRGRRCALGGAADVRFGDPAARTGALESVQIDAELGCESPGDGGRARTRACAGGSGRGSWSGRRRRGRRGRSGRCRRGRRRGAVDGQARDHVAEPGRLVLTDRDLAEHAVDLGLVHDRGLVGLDLDERLALRDRIARLLEPAQDDGLLHRVREPRHHDVDEAQDVSASSVAVRMPRARE